MFDSPRGHQNKETIEVYLFFFTLKPMVARRRGESGSTLHREPIEAAQTLRVSTRRVALFADGFTESSDALQMVSLDFAVQRAA